MRYGTRDGLFPLEEHISSYMSALFLSYNRGGDRRLGSLFTNGMIGNPVAQNDLCHHFGVHVDHSTVYAFRKNENGTI